MRDLLIEARHEILRLRRENEILSAKVQVMDLMASMLGATPGGRLQDWTGKLDIAYRIEQELGKQDTKVDHAPGIGSGL